MKQRFILLIIVVLSFITQSFALNLGSVFTVSVGDVEKVNFKVTAITPRRTVSIGSGLDQSGTALVTRGVVTSFAIPETVTGPDEYTYYVTSVSNYAFQQETSLEKIYIPSTVETIGEYAFNNCTKLTNLNGGAGIKIIKPYAFSNCKLLSIGNLTGFSNVLETVGEGAFGNCSQFRWGQFPVSLKSIGEYAFQNTGISSVTIPYGITKIPKAAFYGTSIAYLTLPESVNEIGTQAFQNTKLYSITLPGNIKTIQSKAFAGSANINSVTIKNAVPPTIATDAFDNYTATLCVPKDCTSAYQSATTWKKFTNIKESSQYGQNYEFTTQVNNVDMTFKIIKLNENNKYDVSLGLGTSGTAIDYSYEGTLTIPESFNMSSHNFIVTEIGSWALSLCKGLTSVTIPNGVTSIGDRAFSGCSGLTSVTIPNSATSIGSGAFANCSGLTSITIGSGIETIGAEAFYSCPKLTDVYCFATNVPYTSSPIFEDSSIGNATLHVPAESVDAYKDAEPWKNFRTIQEIIEDTVEIDGIYYNLRSEGEIAEVVSNPDKYTGEIVIPESVTYKGTKYSVTSIGISAFSGCSGLTSVTIPNSVTSIGIAAFSGCSGLTSVTIPNSVTSIEDRTFYNCSGLTSVTIPNSVKSISNYAFWGCSGLTSVTIPYSVTSIGSSAFSSCSGLTSITIPNSVTRIVNGVFKDCSGLTSITIPNSVTSIGIGAFANCSGLTSVTIPNSVTSIGSSAFSSCSGLTSITIPNSVTRIENGVFKDCSGLTSVTIGSGMGYLGSRAFASCPELTDVYCYAINVPNTTEPNAFEDSSIENATLHVPAESLDAYKAAEPWKDFKEIVEIQPAQTDKETLSVKDINAKSSITVEMPINLTNESEDLTAYQFDLILPDGISLGVNDKGKYVVSKTSRYEDDSQTLSVSNLEDSENSYRFILFSMSNEVITGTSGAILNAVIAIDANIVDGTYEGKITNIVFTKTDGTQLKLNDAKFNIIVTNVIPGDANGDGEVNVTDIVEIVNYIMEKPSAKFVAAAADLNGDGEINVTDIVKVVSIIMSAGANASRRVSAMEIVDNDQLTMAVDNDRVCSLCLDNEAQYVASQFEIRLGDGQTLEGISLNGKRSDGHLMSYTKTGNNVYKVVVFSTENRPFIGNSGEFLSFKVSGNGSVEVGNILFVTYGEAERTFPLLYAGTTGTNVVKSSEVMDIYSIDGRMVRRQVTSTNDLEKGVYIINGKKTIVK